ncbi:MAG: amidohydrolase family protein [bacterium]
MKTNTNLCTLSLMVLIIASSEMALGSDPVPAPKQKHPIALVGGTIYTVSGAVILNGTIVFDKGKIVALGQNPTLPPGTEKISVNGKSVYPGLIDSWNSIGLTEIGTVPGSNDQSEGASNLNPNIRVEYALNAESEMIPVARSNGITVAVTVPSGGLISGMAAAIELDGWTWEDLTYKSQLGLVINWPGDTERGRRGGVPVAQTEETQATREDPLKPLNAFIASARAYALAKKAEREQNVPYHNIDLRLQAMIPVLEGTVPLLVRANSATQIQSAIAWCDREGLKMILVGGREGWRVTEQLQAKNIPVIITGVQAGPSRDWEAYDQVFSLAATLNKAGIRFAIAGDGSPSNSRNVPYHAANAVAYGLPQGEGLKAVTLYAAQILGLGDRLGSLAVGKDATLIVTDGDPLLPPTHTLMEFIQGKKIDLRDKHKQLFEKYTEKYQQIKK